MAKIKIRRIKCEKANPRDLNREKEENEMRVISDKK